MKPTPRLRRLRRDASRLAVQVLVVGIGVGLALWADGWRDSRVERRTESARLQALQRNVQVTARAVAVLRVDAREIAAALDSLLAPETDPQSADPGAMRLLLMRGFLDVPILDAELAVYRDLQSSGELSLLKDARVREALSAMDTRYERLRGHLSDLLTVQQMNVDPFLIARVNIPSLVGGETESRGGGDGSSFALDPELRRDRTFRNVAAFKLDILWVVDGSAEDLAAALDDVARAVATRLEALGVRAMVLPDT
jgi:hypothetical protein